MPKMTKNTTRAATTTQPVIVDTPRGRGRPMSEKTLALIAASGMTVSEYKALLAQQKEEMNARRISGEVKRGRKPGSKNKQTVTSKQVQPQRQQSATHTAVKAQTIKAQEARGIQPVITQIVRPAETYIVKNSKGKDEKITFTSETVYNVKFPCCNHEMQTAITSGTITCNCGTIAKI